MKRILLLACLFEMNCGRLPAQVTTDVREVTVATFNVSMEAGNYAGDEEAGTLSEQVLITALASGKNKQIRNIACIIQEVRPDIILLNEFDYIAFPKQGVEAFLRNYLSKGCDGRKGLEYPYYFYSTVNTGQPSPYDLDRDGGATGKGNDAWGFGHYPGQYGMLLLSRFPIETGRVRTFQHFRWKDMPGHLKVQQPDGSDWYTPEAWADFPLSSKSHWDVPVKLGEGKYLHLLASHPTPPVFDDAEDRNGKRNHDEIRFWQDYISGGSRSAYIYDDKGTYGGLGDGEAFVILGDLNAAPDEGDARREGIAGLLDHPAVQSYEAPASVGGAVHSPGNPKGRFHTTGWRMRADYLLPSRKGLKVIDSGVFWPEGGRPLSDIVNDREASSDHRLVWLKLRMAEN